MHLVQMLFHLHHVLCVTFVVAHALPSELERLANLKRSLQVVLDEVVAVHPKTALQLGWKSDIAEFALASGRIHRPDEAKPRHVTVNDTFLFGSGTKPFTAAAVMALVDRGAVSLDDSLGFHIDPVLDRLHAGASLKGLFGANASRITVGQVLRMQSGVQDFDFPPFDNYLLRPNETYSVHSPYEFVEYASRQKPKLLCEPGTCVSYSSNNFVLAGFILLAHANVTGWWQLDLLSFFPAATHTSFRRLSFLQRERLDASLTVPGHTGGGWAQTPPTSIWNQSSSILGWTCGNMVGTALDVAGFIWDMLGPTPRVLPAHIVSEMKQFKPLNLGWATGSIQYGTGLMIESVRYTGHPPAPPDWGTYIGHGGDTYGFLSEQGIVSGLNASVAIVANQDTDGGIVQRNSFCKMIQVSASVLLDVKLDLRCGLSETQLWV